MTEPNVENCGNCKYWDNKEASIWNIIPDDLPQRLCMRVEDHDGMMLDASDQDMAELKASPMVVYESTASGAICQLLTLPSHYCREWTAKND